jgi:hypothetical protein
MERRRLSGRDNISSRVQTLCVVSGIGIETEKPLSTWGERIQ